MTTVPLTADPRTADPPKADSPNARFLAGDVTGGANAKVRFGNAFGVSLGVHLALFMTILLS